ncbi:hypothetical protein F511_27962 [Dorcoceras hygrometricum]|uniref:Uncharacterized protein n=1 Tax=Dorcoceras hygrometricum TaxID=472368 RepID=A0A2Z7AUJ1_9LAMI|nr:hypothetical protein F511_27962 [Dorcoceras hygrometricum]
MMTSAVMSSQSAVDKKHKSWISDDDVSSDVITISSELKYNQSMSTGNPDASYSDPVASTSRPASGQPAASTDFQMVSLPPAGQPVAVVEDTTSSEAVDELYYEDLLKLDVNY